MEKLITIISFFHIHETGIPCSLLESEGIECFVQDAMSVPYTGLAVSGIKIQVKESDVPRAMKILKDGGFLEDTISFTV